MGRLRRFDRPVEKPIRAAVRVDVHPSHFRRRDHRTESVRSPGKISAKSIVVRAYPTQQCELKTTRTSKARLSSMSRPPAATRASNPLGSGRPGELSKVLGGLKWNRLIELAATDSDDHGRRDRSNRGFRFPSTVCLSPGADIGCEDTRFFFSIQPTSIAKNVWLTLLTIYPT